MKEYYIEEFCKAIGIQYTEHYQNISILADSISYELEERLGIDKETLLNQYEFFIQYKMKLDAIHRVQSMTIIGGVDKNGKAENVKINLNSGDIIAIVGATGSGKSRLLEDIEWMAQNDTPTKRQILINSEIPDNTIRFSAETKLVAQLSQNMNFIMDTSVYEFITLHAESRGVLDIQSITKKIIDMSNELAGEPFDDQTPLTALSGGQSRALMIADTAYLSNSPIVLIDEIENAGIDRRKALNLLVQNEKIIILATHDPILALMAEKRVVIENGGISKIINTSQLEKSNLDQLEIMDQKLLMIRNRLRNGDTIETI